MYAPGAGAAVTPIPRAAIEAMMVLKCILVEVAWMFECWTDLVVGCSNAVRGCSLSTCSIDLAKNRESLF